MEEESKDHYKEEIYLKGQSENEQHIQSITLVIPIIEDPVIIGWSIPNTNFQRFLCGNELEEAISNIGKVCNGEV